MARCFCGPHTIFKRGNILYSYVVYYDRAYHRTIHLSNPGEGYSLYRYDNFDQYSHLSLYFIFNSFPRSIQCFRQSTPYPHILGATHTPYFEITNVIGRQLHRRKIYYTNFRKRGNKIFFSDNKNFLRFSLLSYSFFILYYGIL